MASPQTRVTVTFRQAGAQPPVYVAGTFSDPQWQPLEMNFRINEDGQHIFERDILADGGSEIQYKFKIGHGDWWALDDEAEQVSDGNGNTNNLMRVSHTLDDMLPDIADEEGESPGHHCSLFPHECPHEPDDRVVDYPHSDTNDDDVNDSGFEAETRGSQGAHSDQVQSVPSLPSIQESVEEHDEDRNGGVYPETIIDVKIIPATSLDDAISEDQDEGICMSIDDNPNHSQTNLVRRRIVNSSEERPSTPASMRSIQEASEKGNWLCAFFHTIFVDWIGDFLSRILFGNRRKALLTFGTALLFVGVFWTPSRDRLQRLVAPYLDQK